MYAEKQKQAQFIFIVDQALNEMECNQPRLATIERLRDVDGFYNEMKKELKKAKGFLKKGGSPKIVYRYLQMNVFFQHETFFMDLFDTGFYPCLFDLFEYELGGSSC